MCLLSCELRATEEVEEVSWDSGISKFLLLLQSRFDCKKQVKLSRQQPGQCPATLIGYGPIDLYPAVALGYPAQSLPPKASVLYHQGNGFIGKG